MRHTVSFFVCVALAFSVSCSCEKKSVSSKSAETVTADLNAAKPEMVAQPVIEENYRFTVSFISIGSGPDFKAYQIFKSFISEFNKSRKDTIAFDRTPWGREGEVDYCFKLTELTSKEQEKFVSDIKTKLKESTLVRYKENSPCSRKRRTEE